MRILFPAFIVLLFGTTANAEMIKIPWKGDYAHNSSQTWSRDNPNDSGFSKNFENGTPEEMDRVEKDGQLWAEIIPPIATVPVPYMIVMHGCTGLDKVSNAWAHHVADVLNAERIGVVILDSFGSRFMKHTCGMPDLHWGRRRADDAYSALDYLIEQKLALPDQVYLMGQSNGGIATLIAMSDKEADHANKFAAGFPVTPSCTNTPVKYGNYVRPMIIFAGDEDDANPPKYCVEMLKKNRADPIQLIVYKNSNHAFMFNYPGKYVVKWALVIQQGMSGVPLSPEARTEAIKLANQGAIAANDDAFTLARSGHILTYLGYEYERGSSMVELAVDLNPNLAIAWYARGWVALMCGEPHRSIESFERMVRLSPLDSLRVLAWNGISFARFCLGQYEEGCAWGLKSVQFGPDAHTLGAYVMNAIRAGKSVEASEAVARLLRLQPHFCVGYAKEAFPIRLPEIQDRIATALRDAGVPD